MATNTKEKGKEVNRYPQRLPVATSERERAEAGLRLARIGQEEDNIKLQAAEKAGEFKARLQTLNKERKMLESLINNGEKMAEVEVVEVLFADALEVRTYRTDLKRTDPKALISTKPAQLFDSVDAKDEQADEEAKAAAANARDKKKPAKSAKAAKPTAKAAAKPAKGKVVAKSTKANGKAPIEDDWEESAVPVDHAAGAVVSSDDPNVMDV